MNNTENDDIVDHALAAEAKPAAPTATATTASTNTTTKLTAVLNNENEITTVMPANVQKTTTTTITNNPNQKPIRKIQLIDPQKLQQAGLDRQLAKILTKDKLTSLQASRKLSLMLPTITLTKPKDNNHENTSEIAAKSSFTKYMDSPTSTSSSSSISSATSGEGLPSSSSVAASRSSSAVSTPESVQKTREDQEALRRLAYVKKILNQRILEKEDSKKQAHTTDDKLQQPKANQLSEHKGYVILKPPPVDRKLLQSKQKGQFIKLKTPTAELAPPKPTATATLNSSQQEILKQQQKQQQQQQQQQQQCKQHQTHEQAFLKFVERNAIIQKTNVLQRQTPIPGTSARQTPMPGTSPRQTPIPGTAARQAPIPGTAARQTPIPGTLARQTPIPGKPIKLATKTPTNEQTNTSYIQSHHSKSFQQNSIIKQQTEIVDDPTDTISLNNSSQPVANEWRRKVVLKTDKLKVSPEEIKEMAKKIQSKVGMHVKKAMLTQVIESCNALNNRSKAKMQNNEATTTATIIEPTKEKIIESTKTSTTTSTTTTASTTTATSIERTTTSTNIEPTTTTNIEPTTTLPTYVINTKPVNKQPPLVYHIFNKVMPAPPIVSSAPTAPDTNLNNTKQHQLSTSTTLSSSSSSLSLSSGSHPPQNQPITLAMAAKLLKSQQKPKKARILYKPIPQYASTIATSDQLTTTTTTPISLKPGATPLIAMRTSTTYSPHAFKPTLAQLNTNKKTNNNGNY